MNISRRDILKVGLGAAALSSLPWLRAQNTPARAMITKIIPLTGERLPIIGIGTALSYDNPTPEGRAEIKEVFRLFTELGGKLVDTAASYGEPIVGEVVSELGNRDQLFLATKVGVGGPGIGTGRAAGLAQIHRSFQRLRSTKLDLIAVHNLADTDIQLGSLRDLKRQGRIRYLGVTTSSEHLYGEVERVMKAQPLDVLQVDFAIDNRNAAVRMIPLAEERGMAVFVNQPFGGGRLWNAVQGKTLPEWAAEFDCQTWAQFFLKYVVSLSAVTCAIPGTANVAQMRDRLGAAQGRLPDAAMRNRMEQFVDQI